jgi:hypothetical protein
MATEAPKVAPIPFTYTFHGFIKGGYTYIPYNASDSQIVGHDSGFRIYDTRLEFSGAFGKWVDFDISLDTLSTIDPTTGLAPAQVGFEDAYTTLHLGDAWLRLGQFKTPFNGEFLLDDQYIPFVRRSAVSEGLAVDEANTPEPGILLDRQLGAMIGERIPFGPGAGLTGVLAAVNGNGSLQTRNDNPSLALVARIAAGFGNSQVAVSGYWNDRTQGTLSTRQDERDLAADLDFLFNTNPFAMGATTGSVKIFGMVAYKHTQFITVPQNFPVNSVGGVFSIGLPVDLTPVVFEPALRYTYFEPDSTLRTPGDNGASGAQPFALQDATVGVTLSPIAVPLRFQINYTYRYAAAVWEQPSTLLELMLQANF